MELVLVTNTSRNAVVELTEAGKYYSKKEYDILILLQINAFVY